MLGWKLRRCVDGLRIDTDRYIAGPWNICDHLFRSAPWGRCWTLKSRGRRRRGRRNGLPVVQKHHLLQLSIHDILYALQHPGLYVTTSNPLRNDWSGFHMYINACDCRWTLESKYNRLFPSLTIRKRYWGLANKTQLKDASAHTPKLFIVATGFKAMLAESNLRM